MSSQSADSPAPDQSPAPVGMRELPPQPAKPVMPAYTMPAPALPLAGQLPVPQAAVPQSAFSAADASGPGPEDSVIARDDHFEGTFTSRGTICVMGSVKGRIEAVRVRIEEDATVDADVIVDEAIVAGNFTGNLTCRERLEARPSGRINGRVETYRLMLHEGARVEGEMHMLTEAPRDASMTIRGSAPVRGETTLELTDASIPAATAGAKPAPSVTPASAAKPATARPAAPRVAPEAGVTSGGGVTASAMSGPTAGAPAGAEPAVAQRRSPVAETLRLETLLVSPRTMTSPQRYSNPSASPRPTSTSRPRGGTTTGF